MRYALLISLILATGRLLAWSGGEAVTIGGIKQWVQVEGTNPKAPVLLFIHGGPGNSAIGYRQRFTKQLTKEFVVVFWDQRASGKTATLQAAPLPLRVDQFVNDALEVILHLRSRFHTSKIYIVGHSWGGYLALRAAAAQPDWLHGVFAISPMISQQQSEEITLAALVEKARRENDSTALRELLHVRVPFGNGRELYYHRKWLSVLQQSATPGQTTVENWAATWLDLFNEASRTDFRNYAPSLNCPVYFLIGRHDYQTHFSLADSYYQRLICSDKQLIWFEKSAHNPHLTETAAFEKVLIDIKAATANKNELLGKD